MSQPWYQAPSSIVPVKSIAIIGAGLAGMALCYHLTQAGLSVTLIDQNEALPSGASANFAALVKPQLSPDHNLSDQYYTEAFRLFIRFIEAYPELILSRGILDLSHNLVLQTRHQKILAQAEQNLAQEVNATDASAIAGILLTHPALYLPTALLLDVPAYYQKLQQLCTGKFTLVAGSKVSKIVQYPASWSIQTASHTISSDALIFAHGYQGFEPYLDHNPLIPCPGQLSLITPEIPLPLNCTLSFQGYLTPALQGRHILGASFRHHAHTDIRAVEHQQNLAYLAAATPLLHRSLNQAPWQGWCAMRTTSHDHLPLIGPAPIKADWFNAYERIKYGDFRSRIYPDCPYYPNLYMSLAHGSKGVISSFYAGLILTELICKQQVMPTKPVWQAIHPARFWLRQLKQTR